MSKFIEVKIGGVPHMLNIDHIDLCWQHPKDENITCVSFARCDDNAYICIGMPYSEFRELVTKGGEE